MTSNELYLNELKDKGYAIIPDVLNTEEIGEAKQMVYDWQKTIDTNLSSYFFFAREVAEKMLLRRTEGVIVNVSSISSSGNAGQTSYSASKAAVDALTVTWAQELANLKIRVAGVAPGMTDTQMPQDSMNASTLKEWINKTPMGRMAHSSEIADGVLFVLEKTLSPNIIFYFLPHAFELQY